LIHGEAEASERGIADNDNLRKFLGGCGIAGGSPEASAAHAKLVIAAAEAQIKKPNFASSLTTPKLSLQRRPRVSSMQDQA